MAAEIELLGRTVKRVQYRQHREADRRLAAAGVTLVQWDALRAIARRPGASAHALAMATFQTDQAFGTLTNRLVAQGLIERRPGHGRRIEHHLSAAGKKALAAGTRIALDVLAEIYRPLSEAERRTLLGLLSRVLEPEDA